VTQILLVDDEPVLLRTLQRVLRAESAWETTACERGADAVQHLASTPVDVIVSDLSMPGMDGITLLRHVRDHHPGVARIVLSGNAVLSASVHAAAVAHQYLAKPCPGPQLRETIARAVSCLEALGQDGARARAARLASLPPMPRTFATISAALQDERAPTSTVADLVARDVSLASKVLQLVNGAFFGQAQKVTSVEFAVRLLGANVLRSIVLSEELFGSHRGKPHSAAIERLQKHSLAVATQARHMAGDRGEAETAFAAALLHEVGKLVLLAPGDDAASPDADIHATLGGRILALWGLPDEITDAVLYHHAPAECPRATRRLAALVHAADALVHQRSGSQPAAPVDQVTIDAVGLSGALKS
jgi:putative nucleotidyltransferase with HDIG domain